MSNIDQGISEAFQRYGFHSVPIGLTTEIKQAFVDAGWNPGELSLTNDEIERPAKAEGVHAKSLLTGHEWCTLFVNELKKPWTEEGILEPQYSSDEQTYFYTAEHVHEIAKKVSGVEND